MKKIFILLLFFVFFAHAHEENCSFSGHTEIVEITNLAKNLNFEAASPGNIQNAHCLRQNPFTEQEMKQWLDSQSSRPVNSRTINGITFKNESQENLKAFEHLTTALDIFGKKEPARQKKFNSKCINVQCAVKEIFGNQVGMQLLFMQRKFGMNGSHLHNENADSWRKSELDHIMLSLSDFPDGVLPIRDSKTLVKFKRGYQRRGGDNTIANAVIEVFDLWNEEGPEFKRMTITHELGHVIAGESKLDDSPEWMNLGGWKEETKIVNGEKVSSVSSSKKETMVSKYGMTNNWEDLAESVVAYRYNPAALKNASPEKYDLIKKLIFDNVEYTSERACSNPKRLSTTLIEQSMEKIKNWTPSVADLDQIAKMCNGIALTKLGNGPIDLSHTDFQECYEKEINGRIKKMVKDMTAKDPHHKFMGPMLRNLKLPQMTPAKLKQVTDTARTAHRTILRKEIDAALKKNYFFNPKCDKKMLEAAHIYLNPAVLDTFSQAYRVEFQNFSHRTCQELKEKSSLRRFLGLDFSSDEIQEQLNISIK